MLPAPSTRLSLREAAAEDAGFMLRLLTEPSWSRFIRSHDVDSEPAARAYLQDRIIPGYGAGLGFWVVELQKTETPVGICGLIKRDHLEHPDLGFALLEQYWGLGYAREASEAVISYARKTLGLNELLAISSPDNTSSHGLLERLGFQQVGESTSPDGQRSINYRMSLIK